MNTRELLHSLADVLADRLDGSTSDRRYYDQHDSPLPADTHTRLVREGQLPGFKVRGRVLVERADMHRFIEAHRVEPTAGAGGTSEDQAVRDILAGCPTVKRGSHAA